MPSTVVRNKRAVAVLTFGPLDSVDYVFPSFRRDISLLLNHQNRPRQEDLLLLYLIPPRTRESVEVEQSPGRHGTTQQYQHHRESTDRVPSINCYRGQL